MMTTTLFRVGHTTVINQSQLTWPLLWNWSPRGCRSQYKTKQWYKLLSRPTQLAYQVSKESKSSRQGAFRLYDKDQLALWQRERQLKKTPLQPRRLRRGADMHALFGACWQTKLWVPPIIIIIIIIIT